MKRLLGLVIVAILGIIVAEASNHLFSSLSCNQAKNLKTTTANFKLEKGGGMVDLTYAAEKSINTVVHIKTQSNRSVFYGNNFWDLLDPSNGNSIKKEPMPLASGSGVIVTADGYIVTNGHVIEGADLITIILNDKREFKAKVIGVDKGTDIALLKIDANDLSFIQYGNSDDLKIGEWVLAVGNPFNLTSTVTAGIISAKGRDINSNNNQFALESFIQTDAAVNPGNSGGALVNMNGDLVGINTAIASTTGAYAGYSFAIPVNLVKKIIDDLMHFGQAQRVYLGIQITDIDAKLASQLNLNQLEGVYVVAIESTEKAQGLLKDDIILKIGNNPVNKVTELKEQLGRYRPGDHVDISVKRMGKEISLPIIFKNSNGNTDIVKSEPENAVANEDLGATFASVKKDDLRKLGLANGVRVEKITGGKMAMVGVQEGFIITNAFKRPVNNVNDLIRLINNNKGSLQIEGFYPNGMHSFYSMTY